MQRSDEFEAHAYPAWTVVPDYWRDRARAATPFQTDAFLSAWYETFGRLDGVTPVLLEILRKSDRAPAALFPLVLQNKHGLREIGFADEELTDNAAPLIGEAFPSAQPECAGFWRVMRSALPKADIVRLEKMPARLCGRNNPLADIKGCFPAPLTRHVIRLPNTLDEYAQLRTPKFNKEQRRVWKVFTRYDDSKFEMLHDPTRAAMLADQMDTQQARRMKEIGATFRLGDPHYKEFTRRLLQLGLADGSVRFGALTVDNELVGGLLGVSNGTTEAFLRISHASGQWSACSPGRLILEKVIETVHAQGAREIDLSVGDFPYKHAFGVVAEPLYNLVAPLSWRGSPLSLGIAIRQRLRRNAAFRKMHQRFVRGGKKQGAIDDAVPAEV